MNRINMLLLAFADLQLTVNALIFVDCEPFKREAKSRVDILHYSSYQGNYKIIVV